MQKPTKRAREPIYFYSECMRYLEWKYKFDANDFAGKFTGDLASIDRKPFFSFWHWVLDRQSVCNGGMVYFSPDDLEQEFEEKEQFAATIIRYILDEYLAPGEEYVVMLCEW